MSDLVRYATDGPAAVLTLNRPEKRNALSRALIAALADAFARAATDDSRCVILTGSGKESVFFKSRSLSPAELFPGAKQTVGTEARPTFTVGNSVDWTEAHIMALYGASPVNAAPPAEPSSAAPSEAGSDQSTA